MALLTPPGLIGIHVNMPATVPDDVAKALQAGGSPPAGSRTRRTAGLPAARREFYKRGLGYAIEMANRPQTLYGLVDLACGNGIVDDRSRHQKAMT